MLRNQLKFPGGLVPIPAEGISDLRVGQRGELSPCVTLICSVTLSLGSLPMTIASILHRKHVLTSGKSVKSMMSHTVLFYLFYWCVGCTNRHTFNKTWISFFARSRCGIHTLSVHTHSSLLHNNSGPLSGVCWFSLPPPSAAACAEQQRGIRARQLRCDPSSSKRTH